MYSMALGPRCFKWKMLSLSGPNASLLIQLLIVLLTRPVVNVCAKDFLFVSLVTNQVSLEEVCLPSFDVLNCWLNLAVSCLDDDNELPFRLQTTQPTSGGAVTADSSCCANCVEPPRPQQWGPDLPVFFWYAGHADPLDGWRCCSQKRVMSRPIQVRQL